MPAKDRKLKVMLAFDRSRAACVMVVRISFLQAEVPAKRSTEFTGRSQQAEALTCRVRHVQRMSRRSRNSNKRSLLAPKSLQPDILLLLWRILGISEKDLGDVASATTGGLVAVEVATPNRRRSVGEFLTSLSYTAGSRQWTSPWCPPIVRTGAPSVVNLEKSSLVEQACSQEVMKLKLHEVGELFIFKPLSDLHPTCRT